MRVASLVSAIVSAVLLASCTVGDITDPGPGSNANGCVPRLADPQVEAHLHAAGGTNAGTNAGTGCIDAGCHNAQVPGVGAPPYQFAGTVYKMDGVTPNAGATVRVKAMNGTVETAIADSAGNFYIAAGKLPMAFPATTEGTACPSVTKMVTPLTNADGNCNRGGCHSPANVAGQGPILVMD